jgi:hypothetical protein
VQLRVDARDLARLDAVRAQDVRERALGVAFDALAALVARRVRRAVDRDRREPAVVAPELEDGDVAPGRDVVVVALPDSRGAQILAPRDLDERLGRRGRGEEAQDQCRQGER